MPELSDNDWGHIWIDGFQRAKDQSVDPDIVRKLQEEAKSLGIGDCSIQLAEIYVKVRDKEAAAPALYMLESKKIVVTQALIDLLGKDMMAPFLTTLMRVKRSAELKGERFCLRVGLCGEVAGLTGGALLYNWLKPPKESHSDTDPILRRRVFLAAGVAMAVVVLPKTAMAMEECRDAIDTLEGTNVPKTFYAALAKIKKWYGDRGLLPDIGVQGVQP